jgi:uncharacterized protein (TIGR02246 family)
MNRRDLLKIACLAAASTAALDSMADPETQRNPPMQPDPKDVAKLAHDYTAAWNSKSPDAVSSFFAEDGEIVINRGEPWIGRKRIADMAAGFFADVPDMALTCDEIRCSGSHAVYVWTFTGHDAKSGHALSVRGWEEWEIDDGLKIRSSRGWYDAEDYAAQVAGS